MVASTLRTAFRFYSRTLKCQSIRMRKQNYSLMRMNRTQSQQQKWLRHSHASTRRSIYSSLQRYRVYRAPITHCPTRHCSSSPPSSSSSNENNNNEHPTPRHDTKHPRKQRLHSSQEAQVGVFKKYFWAPEMRDIRHWDKFEWIFSVSSLVQFLGFMSYDYMLLRVLSVMSASGLMIAHTGRRFFVGWFWAFSFAVANAIVIYFMLKEKFSKDLSALNKEETFIYHTFFEPYYITPMEFRQILKLGHFITLKRGETLTVQGLLCDKVFLLLSGQCVVINERDETIGVISGGARKSFIGEIALIDDTQDEATATVKTNSEYSRLLYWNADEFKYLLRHCKADLHVKLVNVFTSSMKIKLMDFNENFNVEKSIKLKQQALESIIQMMLITKGKLRISESDNVDRCELLVKEKEKIELDVDEEIFLSQYIKQKQLNDAFTAKLLQKYHIDFDQLSIM